MGPQILSTESGNQAHSELPTRYVDRTENAPDLMASSSNDSDFLRLGRNFNVNSSESNFITYSEQSSMTHPERSNLSDVQSHCHHDYNQHIIYITLL